MIQQKIQDFSIKINFMLENFKDLEKSLDFIESLENKKFAEDEKMKLLNKMNSMQKYIESLETIISTNNEKEKKGHVKKISNISGGGKSTASNLSKTKIIENKNTQLFNIQEYGYGNGNDEENDEISGKLENVEISNLEDN